MSSLLRTWYPLLFLYIEPLSTIVGAYYAYFQQATYLTLTHPPSSPSALSSTISSFSPFTTADGVPLGTSISLSQLANLYLLFALIEGLVLRASSKADGRVDEGVWRAVLGGMFVADLGHLWSVSALGAGVYWRVWEWNAIMLGNVGFVYLGAMSRGLWLMGVGRRGKGRGKGRVE